MNLLNVTVIETLTYCGSRNVRAALIFAPFALNLKIKTRKYTIHVHCTSMYKSLKLRIKKQKQICSKLTSKIYTCENLHQRKLPLFTVEPSPIILHRQSILCFIWETNVMSVYILEIAAYCCVHALIMLCLLSAI